MDTFIQHNLWTVIPAITGLVVWAIRLEGVVKALKSDVQNNYAKKTETAALQGQVLATAHALDGLAETVNRVEQKIDTLLAERRHGH